jgi:porin
MPNEPCQTRARRRPVDRERVLCALAAGALLLAAGIAHGEPDSAPLQHLGQSPRLLDDPAGARSRLEDLGVSVQLFANGYLGWKIDGGASSADVVRQSASWDLLVRADLEELAGVPGLAALVHVKGTYERNVNPEVGALSDPIDDADGKQPLFVDQLWLEEGLFDGALAVRVGYLDQQTVLDRNAFANNEDIQFMATALDNDPIVPLKIGPGVTLFARPTGWLELALGAADADSLPRRTNLDSAFDDLESLMGYFEVGARLEWPSARGPLPGHYRVGAFLDATRKPVFGRSEPFTGDPLVRRGHAGVYLSFDQLLFREREGSGQGLGIFARYGHADGAVNAVEHFWSLGLQYEGLLPCRDEDVVGVAVYQAIGSGRYRRERDPDFDRETGVELYYRIALLPWLALTPDLQLIAQPGGSRHARDAAVGVLRARIAF